MWPELKFDKETRTNFQPGAKTYDALAFNRDHFEFYKKLTAIRNTNPVLAEGKMEFITAIGNILSYKRYTEKAEIMVLFNLESGKHGFDLPVNHKYIDLLTNKPVDGRITLDALSAAILRLEK